MMRAPVNQAAGVRAFPVAGQQAEHIKPRAACLANTFQTVSPRNRKLHAPDLFQLPNPPWANAAPAQANTLDPV